jgi:hypothetical protein
MIKNGRCRNKNGNMLALVVATTAIIFVPILALLSGMWLHLIRRERAETVVEAAVKVAALDLSRIVINDQNFGYLSLSNHPATGKRTQSGSGEALPVIALQTWQSTLDQNEKIAKGLQNDTVANLVSTDRVRLQSAVKDFNRQFQLAVEGDPRVDCFDGNGKRVLPLQDVSKFLADNLPSNVELQSTKLSVGYLEDASDVLEPQAHLVSNSKFQDADDRHIPDVVKLECTFMSKDQPGVQIRTVACAQAYCLPDKTVPGGMNVRFSGRPVLGLLTWNEFLSDNSFRDNKVINYDVANGDFPIDPDARLQQKDDDSPERTSQKFAEHLYSWLRNARMHVRPDAVMAMMNESFRPYPNQIYSYQIAGDGSVTRSEVDGANSRIGIATDGEVVSMVDTRVKGGAFAIIMFRDNVENLDANSKHGGQPFQGLALDIEIGGTGDSTATHDVASVRARTRNRRV